MLMYARRQRFFFRPIDGFTLGVASGLRHMPVTSACRVVVLCYADKVKVEDPEELGRESRRQSLDVVMRADDLRSGHKGLVTCCQRPLSFLVCRREGFFCAHEIRVVLHTGV